MEDLEDPACHPLAPFELDPTGRDGRIDVDRAGQKLGEDPWLPSEHDVRLGERLGRERQLSAGHRREDRPSRDPELEAEVVAVRSLRTERATEREREGAGAEEVVLIGGAERLRSPHPQVNDRVLELEPVRRESVDDRAGRRSHQRSLDEAGLLEITEA